MLGIVITLASFIWPLVVLVVAAVVWHTRGRRAYQLKRQLEARQRTALLSAVVHTDTSAEPLALPPKAGS